MSRPVRILGSRCRRRWAEKTIPLGAVWTAGGAEGLSLGPERDFAMVKRVEDMASALVEAIGAPGRAHEPAVSGRRSCSSVTAEMPWLSGSNRSGPTVW